MKRSITWVVAAVSALCLLALSGSAGAVVPGDLDTGFGVGGKVTTHNLTHAVWVQALVVQPDGKLVAAGVDMLARYNADGTLDTTFGSGGTVTTDLPGPFSEEVDAVVLQPDGKIVAAGRASGSGGMDFALVRYNANGTLDMTFGDGGMVTTDFAANSDWARGLVVQPDGKIVAAGRASYSPSDFGLVRYNPDGTLDPTFGSGGKVTTDFGSGSDFAYALVRQQDGKLVAGGGCKLARYNLDGSLDPTFGNGGKVETLFTGCYDTPLAIQADGKFLTTGFNTVFPGIPEFGVARYNPDGTLDTTFASGGKLTSDFEVLALLNQPDGKLVTAGRSRAPAADDFNIARYEPDGTPDPSFGNGQTVTTDFSGGYDWANALAYQPDGNLVAAGQAGTSTPPSLGPSDFGLVRYLGVVRPVNDAFALPMALGGLTAPISATNEDATKETGEPWHGSSAGGASVWFSWAPSFTGTAFVSTAGSDFDTLLGVYTGPAVNSLNTVGSNDDGWTSSSTSRACFPVTAGTTYRIAVDGYAAALGYEGSEGNVELAWGPYTSTDPCPVMPPKVAGTPAVGATLTATKGDWVGTVSDYEYQWLACHPATDPVCHIVSGATGSSYTPTTGTVGHTLIVRVTAKHESDPLLDAVGYSLPTAPVPTPPGGGGGEGGGGGGTSVPDLTVALTANAITFQSGAEADLVATVSNKGGAGSLQTHLMIQLPSTLTLLGPPAYERGSGCTGSQRLDCNLDYIPNGGATKVVFAVRVSGSGAQQITATASSDREANPADNSATLTLQVTAPQAPFAPPSVAKPVFGMPLTRPLIPVAGKRFTFTLAVKRSDTGAPLKAGRMACDPTVAGKPVKHVESFKAGKAQLSLLVPKTAKGKQLKIKIKIVSGGQTATRTVTYRVR